MVMGVGSGAARDGAKEGSIFSVEIPECWDHSRCYADPWVTPGPAPSSRDMATVQVREWQQSREDLVRKKSEWFCDPWLSINDNKEQKILNLWVLTEVTGGEEMTTGVT